MCSMFPFRDSMRVLLARCDQVRSLAYPGAPMRAGAINELLTVLSRRAQLPHAVHPHQLRHGFASNVMDAGGAVVEAHELLGHARAGSTRINAKPAESATQLTL
jgi:site-specific recombinase XerC